MSRVGPVSSSMVSRRLRDFIPVVALVLAGCSGSPPDSGRPAVGSGGRAASGTGGGGGRSEGTGGTPGSGGVQGGATGGAGVGGGGGSPGTGGASSGSGGSGAMAGAAGGGGAGGGSSGPFDAGAFDAPMGTGGSAGRSGAGGGGGIAGGGGTSGASGWVGSWTAAPQLTETANLPPSPLSGSTLRQVVHLSLGGRQMRVRFSNEFGNGPLTITQAHVAVCRATPVDSTIDTATGKVLAFSGAVSVTIDQGRSVWSDALDFAVPALGNVAVTIAFGSVPGDVTGHPGSRTTSYLQSGSSNVGAANMASAQKTDHWYVISGIDVRVDSGARGLVILGDSLTDGRGSTTNGNNRWPDLLAKRLQANASTAAVAVMNQGIGGNALIAGGLGPVGLDRFARDVLGQSGVRWVIVFAGINDIAEGASAAAITAAYDQLIAQAHARNLVVYGATMTPFAGHSYYTVTNESTRQTVNAAIRSGKFDGVIDFDAAVRNTASPPALQPAYDEGDGLHMTPAGYQKLADTVSLSLFTN